MKNPSAVYCQELGYQYQIVTHPLGDQDGICTLPGKQVCPAWDFLNGICGREYSICASLGLDTLTRSDGNNPYSKDYAVCADGRGNVVDSVINISHLVELVDRPGTTQQPYMPIIHPKSVFLSPPLAKPLPPSFDWRNQLGSDWITPVKNQGICGSCWAFSATALAEAVTNIASANPHLDLDLSEQVLVANCLTDGSCAGGAHNIALYYMQTSGIPDEVCLPYSDGSAGGCPFKGVGICDPAACLYSALPECSDMRCSDRCRDWESRLVKIQNVTYLGTNPPSMIMKQALLEHGPLATALYTGGVFNENGIYTCSGNPSPNHSVMIAGYNDDGGYWIVKNSWGSSWGPDHDGYFKVAYDNCAIQLFPFSADGISQGEPSTYTPSSLPFSEHFDSEQLSLGWEESTTNQGRIQISAAYPHSGLFSLQLDDASPDSIYSYASATLHLDLSNHRTAYLTFWWRKFNDEGDSQDGVFIRSDPDQPWCQVLSLIHPKDGFTQTTVDLRTASALCGITFSADFQVRFQYYDNASITEDGYFLDDVQVVTERNLFLPIAIY